MTSPRDTPAPSAHDETAALEALRHALPADTERATRPFAIDGVEPQIAFTPDDPFEIAEALRIAANAGLVVAPQGTRTALSLGRPLARYDVAIETRALHRIIEYVPDDLTVTVEAGMHLDALQHELHEHGQYLSVDPPPDDHVSIGGLLATARPGAWRGHLPAARDLILGARAALPSGELVRSGGRVVKNVTGYDLHRLHTGALGAFGVIVEATFKVAPLPAVTQTLAIEGESVRQASDLARLAWNTSLAARAITVLSPAAALRAELPEAPCVLIELAGSMEAVAGSLREVRALGAALEVDGAAWLRLRRLAADAGGVVLRAGSPPTRLAEMIEEFERAGCVAWAHVASGSVLGNAEHLDGAAVDRLRAAAVDRGGFLQVEAAPAELRREVDPFGAEQIEVVRALKDQLDPGRTINRGRWMEGV